MSQPDPRGAGAAVDSLLAEECFPDFAYYPEEASQELLNEVRARNLAAVNRAIDAADRSSGYLRVPVEGLDIEMLFSEVRGELGAVIAAWYGRGDVNENGITMAGRCADRIWPSIKPIVERAVAALLIDKAGEEQ